MTALLLALLILKVCAVGILVLWIPYPFSVQEEA